jgi:hypothetical protein
VIDIACRVGAINVGLPQPVVLYHTAQQIIGAAFQQASLNDFRLVMQPPVMSPVPVAGGTAVTALDLHVRLAHLVGSPAHGPVNTIGLLMAHSYKNFESALGVMFDRGVKTPDDPNASSTYTNVPRQGCAIFLGAINSFRTNDIDRELETIFTSMHELGHVFNLPHSPNLTLMSTSPSGAPLQYPNVHFDPQQCSWLSHCSTSHSVVPGGSPFGAFGPSGPLDPFAHFDLPRSRRSDRLKKLTLSIVVRPAEFRQWEPVELEVQLSVPNRDRGRYSVPEMLDPAYGCFTIFIEDPRGERRIFQPSIRQCPHGKTMTISAARPYRRDINIGRGDGDYTFKYVGVYRIQVEFRLSAELSLKSNVFEALVYDRGEDDLTSQIFRDRRASTVLRYGQDLTDDKGIAILEHYLKDVQDDVARKSYAQLAVGSAYLQARAGGRSRLRRKDRSSGLDLLRRALDSNALSPIKQSAASRKLKDVTAT